MATNRLNNGTETLRENVAAPVNKESQARPDDSEIKETSRQFAESVDVNVDSNESSEAAEFVDGKVSEVVGKNSENKGQGFGGAAAAHSDPAQIKAQLLKNLPTEIEMKKQIKKEIHKEIRYLHKKAVRMLNNPGEMSYFEMSNLMKKIRELKSILLILAKASMESLKTLWLRFVHGVM